MTTSLPRQQPRRSGKPRARGRDTTEPPASLISGPHRGTGAAVVAVKKIFAAETGNFFLLLGATLFLVTFGLVMVLSSSAVSSYKDTEDSFSGFARQGMFAMLGVPLMLIASRMPAVFWRKWAGIAMVVAVGLQFLVVATPLGVEHGGNRNWISLGSVSVQPSELAKVALVIWLAMILARKRDVLEDWRELAFPLVPVAGAAIGFVLLGQDLGTSIIMIAMVFGALFFAGVRLRHLFIPLVVIGAVGLALGSATNSRQDRISAWLSGCSSDADYSGLCWQTLHGWWALASGGLFGVGLGNSKAKWSWLPEADNDFIFAIVGEELGLIGAVLVLVLFIVLAIAFVRIIRANTDPFARVAVSVVMMWIIGQAFVNIAVVLGMLPVLGVPLPLISAGGSALVTSLVAIGIVLSFARHPVVQGAVDQYQPAGGKPRSR
ncbi:putative lipid II flippase FtsW [Parafrigoribacterium mesophilum]|uniref:putative lipid II flippase FtsW n=1 Tax=Parafrigoribacterium mesophilum TaxID=433646 RepID=UPI0031FD5D7D